MEHNYDAVELKVGDIVIGLNCKHIVGKEFIVEENEDKEDYDGDYPFRAVCLDGERPNPTITLFGWVHSCYAGNPEKPRVVLKRPALLKASLDDLFKVV